MERQRQLHIVEFTTVPFEKRKARNQKTSQGKDYISFSCTCLYDVVSVTVGRL